VPDPIPFNLGFADETVFSHCLDGIFLEYKDTVEAM
jgi:hypothetical protein